MKPKARHLILDLLLAADGAPLSAREAVNACALFGISDNNARVALARLSADGLIEAEERGSYVLSARAHELADDVATWRSAEQRTRAWSGAWVMAHCGALGRSNRRQLRTRQRALDMLGFREFERDLYTRPDNIERDVDAVRARLHQLGLEREAVIFLARDFDADSERRIRALWDGTALNHRYHELRQELETWMRDNDRLSPEVAAREVFVVGGKAIRQVVFDPLLPEPLVDTAARRSFVDTVQRFDRLGHQLWQRLHEMDGCQSGPWLSARLVAHSATA